MSTVENRTYAVIAAVVVLILIAAGLFWARANRAPGSDTPAKTATTTPATTTTAVVIDDRQATVAADGETISADTQSAGPTVRVSFALTHDSWVAVQDANGAVLGAGRFAAGATSGIVELLRPTVPGETYTVVIYADNGNRVFDLYTDELVEGVAASFKAE
jgi:hypothetical protein